MEKYAKGTDHVLCWRVDSFKFAASSAFEKSKQGYRHYFELAQSKEETFERRVLTFVEGCRRRLNAIDDSLLDEPLRIPMLEVGYAINVVRRFYQHRMHSSSNLMISLAHAALLSYHPNSDYDLVQHVVYRIWQPEQAVPAEIIFTRFAQGYSAGGTGFNTYPAGRSNRSAYTVSPTVWEHLLETALKKTPLNKNYKLFGQIARREGEALEQKVEEAAQWVEREQLEEEYVKLTQQLESKKQMLNAWSNHVDAMADFMFS